MNVWMNVLVSLAFVATQSEWYFTWTWYFRFNTLANQMLSDVNRIGISHGLVTTPQPQVIPVQLAALQLFRDTIGSCGRICYNMLLDILNSIDFKKKMGNAAIPSLWHRLHQMNVGPFLLLLGWLTCWQRMGEEANSSSKIIFLEMFAGWTWSSWSLSRLHVGLSLRPIHHIYTRNGLGSVYSRCFRKFSQQTLPVSHSLWLVHLCILLLVFA